ncbi:MAG TPA: methyltransferase domain-containing protein [Anaerolineales bacterium]|nr:methyltransferase domain-containing protein [Anaerolineales bacterium]
MGEKVAVFNFGENWASFSREIDETRMEAARQSLRTLFGEGALSGKSFLDIGCGSGLFSIAAAQLGAGPVLGLDADPVSIATSQRNAAHWLTPPSLISFRQLSVLDGEQLNKLGRFDIVYSWGVLHHTGNMKMALGNTAKRVTPRGMLMIAIYNKHWSSRVWKVIKWMYNHIGPWGRKVLIWILTPVIFLAKWLVTFRNPLKMQRGMEFTHNVVDWVGGYPYEYASIAEMRAALENIGFELVNVFPARVPTGCNEFVCRKRIATTR